MSYYRPRYGFGGMLTPMVKSLLIINILVFLMEYITGGTEIIYFFGLVPRFIVQRFYIWQFFTYMFLHGGLWHLFLNMFILWMFGSEIERYWGSRTFLKYYFITGVGAGLLGWLTAFNSVTPTIGASGAVYGILVAYGMMFPNRPVYLYFLLPIKAKHFVIFLVVMELMASRGDWSTWPETFFEVNDQNGGLKTSGRRSRTGTWSGRSMRSCRRYPERVGKA